MNGEIKRLAYSLILAAILGAWGFAATRASSDDLDKVDYNSKQRDKELEESGEWFRDKLHDMNVEQAAFRAQVREALRIPQPRGRLHD
ncbi:MAG: hypothetical protein CME70_18210 [Halobacteriovorax sp.]|nr:hypothetical protein [Halobacteriovorax sp.]|tara:strand:+ start:5484 stop:5747 length:264 start_codon:yes stop_codon:yes gene_type:complete